MSGLWTGRASFGLLLALLKLVVMQSVAAAEVVRENILVNPCFDDTHASATCGDRNDFGVRICRAGTRLGAWWVAGGDVDHYFIPVSKDHGWYLPGAPPECKHIIDVSGQEPSTVTQIFRTVANGTYTLSFSYAGNAEPDVAPRHAKSTFKTLQLYWDGELIDNVFQSTLGKAPNKLDWEEAVYTLRASSDVTMLALMSSTPGRSGLAVTNFKLLYQGGGQAQEQASAVSSHRGGWWPAFLLGIVTCLACVIMALMMLGWRRRSSSTSSSTSDGGSDYRLLGTKTAGGLLEMMGGGVGVDRRGYGTEAARGRTSDSAGAASNPFAVPMRSRDVEQ